jgi:hypothetical protein
MSVQVASEQSRRRAFVPRFDRHDVFAGDECADMSCGVELVEQRFGCGDVEGRIDQRLVGVVQSHAATLGVFEAAERVERDLTSGFGLRDVLE